jgi:glycosyltransferase involved in cell wall biosynthesis
MRILHLNHTGIVSGAERSLLTLIASLRARHEVVLAAPGGELSEHARTTGVIVVRIRGMSGSLRLHPLRTPRAIAAVFVNGIQVRKLARAERFDVVHANSVRAGLIAAVSRALGGPPFVVHARDVLGPRRAARTIRALLSRGSAGVIAVSDFVASDWSASHVPVERIHNPIDCDEFHPDPADGQAWRAARGLPSSTPLFAVVGQITPWKRQLLAVDAFSELLASEREARLVIAGSVKFATSDTALDNPGYLRRIQERTQELGLATSVMMLGEREDVASIMRAADVLLAPAHDEPFGRAVAESLASGTPVVVAAHGGPAEFVRDGTDGVLVDGDDPLVWARACSRALELAGDEMAEKRRRHACELLGKENHAAAVSALLERVAGPAADGAV